MRLEEEGVDHVLGGVDRKDDVHVPLRVDHVCHVQDAAAVDVDAAAALDVHVHEVDTVAVADGHGHREDEDVLSDADAGPDVHDDLPSHQRAVSVVECS